MLIGSNTMLHICSIEKIWSIVAIFLLYKTNGDDKIMLLGMPIETIITQTLALICNTYVAFSKNNKRIYVATCLFNLFALLTGLLQQDYSLCASYSIVIYRSIIVLFKDKIKLRFLFYTLPVTFVIAHIGFGIYTWTGLWSLIPMIAPMVIGLVLWFSNDLQQYRCGNIVNNGLWLMHNLYSRSYILALTRIYAIVANGCALVRNRNKLLRFKEI